MRRRYVFQGRVQGVGFRYTARSIAARFPVTGWVRNEEDGTVMLEAQGEPAAVEAFVGELKRAMGRGISGTTEMDVADAAEGAGFVIRH